ncbi:MAG TPA: tetratricopeptide repeat protein [Stenotrophomonas sp.]
MRYLLCIALALACANALADEPDDPVRLSTSQIYSRPGEPALGKELRASVQEANALNQKGEHAQAKALLLDAARQCDAYRAAPGRRSLSFRTQRQYELYLRDHGDGEPIDWLDSACANVYIQLGYIAVELRDAAQAIRWLDKAHATAPYEPEALTERGAALNMSKDWSAALSSYQQALALTRSHPEAAYAEALALRGTGYALIELGDLDAAQTAYEESLALEPGNKVAENEMTYIQQQRKRQAGKP